MSSYKEYRKQLEIYDYFKDREGDVIDTIKRPEEPEKIKSKFALFSCIPFGKSSKLDEPYSRATSDEGYDSYSFESE